MNGFKFLKQVESETSQLQIVFKSLLRFSIQFRVKKKVLNLNLLNNLRRGKREGCSDVALRPFCQYLGHRFQATLNLSAYSHNRRLAKQRATLRFVLVNIQAPVVQRLDNAIQRINRYPVDKC